MTFILYKVAWLHADKGTLAVHPIVITQNERLSVRTDSRNTYILTIKDIKESDAGKYICQINTGPPQISISGHINVVGKKDIICFLDVFIKSLTSVLNSIIASR